MNDKAKDDKDKGEVDQTEADRVEADKMESDQSDEHLVKAAKELGAVEIPAAFDSTRKVEDVLGDGKIVFYPELPKVEWSSLVGKRFIVQAIKIVENWDGRFGVTNFPLLKILLEDGTEHTTLGSGVAVMKQVKRLQEHRAFPVQATLRTVQPEGGGQPYYSLC